MAEYSYTITKPVYPKSSGTVMLERNGSVVTTYAMPADDSYFDAANNNKLTYVEGSAVKQVETYFEAWKAEQIAKDKKAVKEVIKIVGATALVALSLLFFFVQTIVLFILGAMVFGLVKGIKNLYIIVRENI